MTLDDITFESAYCVPVSNSAHQAFAPGDPQANDPTDLLYIVREDGRGAQPHVNVYAHSSAPYTMNALALQVEATIMAQNHPWQWIPDTAIGHRGRTGIVVEQAPEVDPYTQPMMSEPREGFRGVYPYSLHTQIPFPSPWE